MFYGLIVLSFIHRPVFLLSPKHYYDIISSLSSILLSGLLSVRCRDVSEKTHWRAERGGKKSPVFIHSVSKDNYIIPAWET